MTLGTKQILGVHKIIRSREVDCSTFLIKHLFHAESSVVNSSLLCFKKLRVTGLAQHYENLYKGSADGVRCKILDNVRAFPKYEYKDFLLNILPREASAVVKEKTILAMGALSGKGELELLNDLRDRVGIGTSSDKICERAIEALFLAGDLDFLSTLCIKFISVDESDWRARKILDGFWGHPNKGAFSKIHRHFKKVHNPLSEHGLCLLRGLFGCYERDSETEHLLIELKEWIIQLCGSQNSKEAEFALNFLSSMNSYDDPSLTVSTLLVFITAPLHTPKLEQQRSQVFGRLLDSIRDKCGTKLTLALSLTLESTVIGIHEVLERKYKERVDRESRPGGEVRTNFLDFFESLGHERILEMVVKYLKTTPIDVDQRNMILSILNKLRPTFSNQQKQRLASVVKLLMEESNRIRAVLAVECSKINFEEAAERLFRRLKFLSPHMGLFTKERLWETLLKIVSISKNFQVTESVRRELLKPLLYSGRENAIQLVFESVPKESEAFQDKLFSDLPPLVLCDLNFLKSRFGKEVHPLRFLRSVVKVLKSIKQINDPDWMRIIIQMETGAFGQITEELRQSIQQMICASDPSAGLQYLSQKAKQQKYQIDDFDLKMLGVVAEGMIENKSKEREIRYLKDLIFGVLKDGPEKLKSELSVYLNQLGEEFGLINVVQYLDSPDKVVLCRAIEACKTLRFGKPWKRIFYFLESNDFLVQNAVVSFFDRDYPEFGKLEVKRVIEGFLEGKKETVDEEMIDAATVSRIVTTLETSTLENTSAFGRDQNMKELTIFFIDIAGYTKRSSTSTIGDVMSMLEDFGKIIEPIGNQFGGTLIKKIGDCFMYTFENRLGSELFSLQVQRELRKYNEFRVETEKLRTRIGLNTGKVYLKEGDVYGDPVNTASRVESKAPLDGTLANETTFNGLEELLIFEKMEPITVKGIDHPLQTYHITDAKTGVEESYLKSLSAKTSGVQAKSG